MWYRPWITRNRPSEAPEARTARKSHSCDTDENPAEKSSNTKQEVYEHDVECREHVQQRRGQEHFVQADSLEQNLAEEGKLDDEEGRKGANSTPSK